MGLKGQLADFVLTHASFLHGLPRMNVTAQHFSPERGRNLSKPQPQMLLPSIAHPYSQKSSPASEAVAVGGSTLEFYPLAPPSLLLTNL